MTDFWYIFFAFLRCVLSFEYRIQTFEQRLLYSSMRLTDVIFRRSAGETRTSTFFTPSTILFPKMSIWTVKVNQSSKFLQL